jgi:hypothetical protein
MYKIIGADLKEYGPVSADQLRQWIKDGRVNGQTKVQAAESTEWKAMADIPEFADVLPKAPALPVGTLPITPLPATTRNSQMALWSMILGIASLSLCCCVWEVMGPLAIVFGAVALAQLKKQPELTGRGFALAGIILGIVSIVFGGAIAVFCMLNPDFVQSLQNKMPR